MTKIETLRRWMQPGVEYTSDQLAAVVDIPRAKIGTLIYEDIQAGRIIKNDEWPRTYRLPTYAEQMAPKIEAATELLRRHGYQVIAPAQRAAG